MMGIRWTKIIGNTKLWEAAGEKLVILQIRMRKWRWIGHTLRKGDESIGKQALDWKPQGARSRGRMRQTWKNTVLEETGK
jgi:hypothetical protein